jgi:hypothetical protein
MTRPIEEIEADDAEARRAWQDSVEAHRLAALAAADLRARAVAADPTLTAADLAAARDVEELAALGIEAKKTAAMALDAELATAKAEAFADDFGVAEASFRADFDQSMEGLELALGRVVDTWRAHATLIERTYTTAAGGHNRSTPRIRFPQYGHPSIDKCELRAVPVFEPVTALVQKTLGSLQRPLR